MYDWPNFKCYILFKISCSFLEISTCPPEDFVGHFCSAMIRAYCELEDWYGPSLPGTVGDHFLRFSRLTSPPQRSCCDCYIACGFGSHISRVKRKSIFQLAVYDRGSGTIPRYPITELRLKNSCHYFLPGVIQDSPSPFCSSNEALVF